MIGAGLYIYKNNLSTAPFPCAQTFAAAFGFAPFLEVRLAETPAAEIRHTRWTLLGLVHPELSAFQLKIVEFFDGFLCRRRIGIIDKRKTTRTTAHPVGRHEYLHDFSHFPKQRLELARRCIKAQIPHKKFSTDGTLL